MQFFKFFPLGLALAVISVQAQDETPAQKRAIEVLRKKIAEMEHPAPSTAPIAAPAASTQPVSAGQDEQKLSEIHRRALEALHQQEPAKSSPPVSNVTSPASTMTDREAEGRARLMLHEQQRAVDSSRPKDSYERGLEERARMMFNNSPRTPEPAPAAPPQANVDARAQELLRQQQAEERNAKKTSKVETEMAAGPADDPNAAIHARALKALHEATAPAPTQPANAVEAKATESAAETPKNNEAPKTAVKAAKREKEKPANTNQKKTVAKNAEKEAPEAAVAPAPPMTKQQKLAELLERYKADQVTPAQYQDERAKILAEP